MSNYLLAELLRVLAMALIGSIRKHTEGYSLIFACWSTSNECFCCRCCCCCCCCCSEQSMVAPSPGTCATCPPNFLQLACLQFCQSCITETGKKHVRAMHAREADHDGRHAENAFVGRTPRWGSLQRSSKLQITEEERKMKRVRGGRKRGGVENDGLGLERDGSAWSPVFQNPPLLIIKR